MEDQSEQHEEPTLHKQMGYFTFTPSYHKQRPLTISLLMYIYGNPGKASNLTLYIYGRDILLEILLLELCISLIYV
jgi:hypothetical protein